MKDMKDLNSDCETLESMSEQDNKSEHSDFDELNYNFQSQMKIDANKKKRKAGHLSSKDELEKFTQSHSEARKRILNERLALKNTRSSSKM